MREGPILFQGDMVSAILEDQKSMTRRVIKPQPVLSPNAGFGQYHHGQMWTYGTYSNGVSNVRNVRCMVISASATSREEIPI